MRSSVIRPHVILEIQGARPVELHATLVAALATKSEAFKALLTVQKTPRQRLEKDVERLLEIDDSDDTPPAWRFIQTDQGYLGPAYFAVKPRDLVATCGAASVWVTKSGFEMTSRGCPPFKFMAVETTKTQTALIRPDGYESGPVGSDRISLAQVLSDGKPYVTAVPTSFPMAVQQPLHGLLARLLEAEGSSVLAT